jgi:hypothetical protein
MSRKLILSLAAIATLASAGLATGSADAMQSRGGRIGIPVLHPIHPGHPGHVHYWPHYHPHFRPVFVHRYIGVRPVDVSVATPATCSCLTKDYSPEGQVVFKDLCTKEMASAPVDGSAAQTSDADPANYAGRTYQDYLAANPQAAAAGAAPSPAPSKN